jgi:hypothetical protein
MKPIEPARLAMIMPLQGEIRRQSEFMEKSAKSSQKELPSALGKMS